MEKGNRLIRSGSSAIKKTTRQVTNMRIIKSQQAIDLLKTMRALPLDVIHLVQSEFRLLYEAYGQSWDIPIQEFHTDAHHCGFIAVLEQGDDLGDLSVIGLPGGFRRTIVEFVELRNTGKRLIYRIVVLFDNEFALTILLEAGINKDLEFEAWLQEESSPGSYLPPTGTTGRGAWEVPF